jgi:hypothetical protein
VPCPGESVTLLNSTGPGLETPGGFAANSDRCRVTKTASPLPSTRGRDQIVGGSCYSSTCTSSVSTHTGTLWQDGSRQLGDALFINDHGEIAVNGTLGRKW